MRKLLSSALVVLGVGGVGIVGRGQPATAPRTVHQIGNVRVLEADGPDARVGSTLVLVEYRRERQRVWGAVVEHRLRRTAQGLRIAAKRVDLVNSEAELDGVVCLL